MTEKPVILCADVTSTMLQGRKMLLEKNGYRVLTAANGKEAVQAFVSHTVDLVLLDYRVPQTDGGVAAIHMRACKPDVPIALLSGDESLPPGALEAVDAFVSKSEPVTSPWKKWITCRVCGFCFSRSPVRWLTRLELSHKHRVLG